MEPIDVTGNSYAKCNKIQIKKILNLNLVTMLEFQNIKNIFAKEYAANWSEEIFVVSKIKNTVPGTYLINDLSGEEITGSFYEKELQKTT